ncbi:UPF0175 family protein [Trichothermofontia sp.]
MIKSVSYSKTMKITLDIPDPIADRLADDRETLTRRSLELLAIEAYRKGTLGAGEVGQLLGFDSRWDTYNFLQKEQAEPPLSEADLENDALLGQA